MKSISAALIVIAGIACFTAGAFVTHRDTGAFVMVVGGIVGALGLIGWFGTLRTPQDR